MIELCKCGTKPEPQKEGENDDSETIIDALRKARKYIRTVEAWGKQTAAKDALNVMLREWTDGGEVEAIEDALAELGVIV